MSKSNDRSARIKLNYRSSVNKGWIEAVISMGGDHLEVPVKKLGVEMLNRAMEVLEKETGQSFLPNYAILPSEGGVDQVHKGFVVSLKERVVRLLRLLLEWVVPPGVLKEKITQALQDKNPVGLVSWQDMEAQDLAYMLLFHGFNPHTLHRSNQDQKPEQSDVLQLTAKYRADA